MKGPGTAGGDDTAGRAEAELETGRNGRGLGVEGGGRMTGGGKRQSTWHIDGSLQTCSLSTELGVSSSSLSLPTSENGQSVLSDARAGTRGHPCSHPLTLHIHLRHVRSPCLQNHLEPGCPSRPRLPALPHHQYCPGLPPGRLLLPLPLWAMPTEQPGRAVHPATQNSDPTRSQLRTFKRLLISQPKAKS